LCFPFGFLELISFMKTHRMIAAICVMALVAACHRGAPEKAASVPTPASVVPTSPLPPIPSAPTVESQSFILVDFASGQMLASSHEQDRMEPASLTKIMTAYTVFDTLRAGRLKLTDTAVISEHAWRVGGAGSDGSTSFLPVHSEVPIEILIQGMTVQSGNDASIALAEKIGGTEEGFAQLMNAYAQRIGMTSTHFMNSTGLPMPEHYTTAHDMALLATAIIRDFPQYYRYFSEREFTYNGITQHNRNGLLERDPTVDGLKTGHTDSAGYCLVTSAKRDDMRLISVVMKAPSIHARESASAALLNYGFNFFENHRFYSAGQALATVRVWKGAAPQVNLGLAKDVVLTLPRGRADRVQTNIDVPPSLQAPLVGTTEVGKIHLQLEGKEIATLPLHPLQEIPAAGVFSRMIDSVKMRFQ
jgi:D-alanyl-D-alanine carboxypeptidase (penicillin-binding protein 5/6)